MGSANRELAARVRDEWGDEFDEADQWFADEYGYALEFLCRTLGDDVLGDIGYLHLLGIDEQLVVNRLPVKIPQPQDFPGIGHLTRDECRAELAKPLTPADEENEVRTELLEACETAIEDERDLVFFYY